MKVFADFGHQRIFHGSCLEMLNSSGDMSVGAVIADWPFKLYQNLLNPVIKESMRVLENGGTFLSIIYPELNYYVRKEAENQGFTFADEILMQTKVSYSIDPNSLPKRTIGILAMVKGRLDDRKWNIDTSRIPVRLLDADSQNITTNFWGDKQFKNGFKNQLIGKHSEAMPRWVVDKMFDTIIPRQGKLLDLFGGAGTILLKSMQRSIPCDSVEIEEKNCSLIRDRLKLECQL